MKDLTENITIRLVLLLTLQILISYLYYYYAVNSTLHVQLPATMWGVLNLICDSVGHFSIPWLSFVMHVDVIFYYQQVFNVS